MKFNILNIHHLQPYKYLHLLRLLEAGFSTRAQDYTRVLAEHVAQCVAGGHVVEQETVPNWVNNTLFLAEKLKYLVKLHHVSILNLVSNSLYLRIQCTPPALERSLILVTRSG